MKDRTLAISLYNLCNRVYSRPLVRDTITTTFLSVVGKGVGFFIPFFIAYWFGVTSDTDAFFFSYGIIVFLATIFSPVLEGIIVPFVAEARQAGDDVGAFVGGALGVITVGLAALTGLLLLFVKPVLALLTRFTPSGLDLIYLVMLEAAPLVVMIVWSGVLAGTLNAYKVFSIPALSPAYRAVVTLSFIFLFRGRLGVHSIALGYVAGEIFRIAVLVGLMRKLTDIRLKFLSWNGRKLRRLFGTSSYQVAGMTASAFMPVINNTLASWVSPGSVSLLEYATRLYMIPYSLALSGFSVTLLSYWSERYKNRGDEGLRGDVRKTVQVIGGIGLLLTVFFFMVKGRIVGLVYGHGRLSAGQLEELSTVFGLYVLGFAPLVVNQIYVGAFLVQKRTKVLMFVSLYSVVLCPALSMIFIRFAGLAGITMAMSLTTVISLFIMSFRFFADRPVYTKKDKRTKAEIREHYEIEKALASRLRNSTREERPGLYSDCYDELYRRVPRHPLLVEKTSVKNASATALGQMKLLRRFLNKDSVFMEVGPGSCALSLEAARHVKHVFAVDVSARVTRTRAVPQNFKLIISDGCSIPLPVGSVDIAYSHQLMEHVHPEDASPQLQNIHKVLVPGGVYVCITPNRLNGPHDISRQFDEVASGFHLKEYTYGELAGLFYNAGFSKLGAYVGGRGIYVKVPLPAVIAYENAVSSLPPKLRRTVARSLPFRLPLYIQLAGTK